MKRKIHNVLRSQTGASISFALLLFLICTVVGALVVTAGTTSSGRLANLTKMDQRYFSVTSAANLLADELNNQSVTITRVRKLSNELTTAYKTVVDSNGRTVVLKDEDSDLANDVTYVGYSTKINDVEISDGGIDDMHDYDPTSVVYESIPDELSFLSSRAAHLLFEDGCNYDPAMAMSMKHGNAHNGAFMLNHSSDDPMLQISGSYEVKEDGTLILELRNAEGDPYIMRVTLVATIDESESENSESKSTRQNVSSGFTETVTTTKTLTKVSKITWIVSGVEKVVSS